MGGLKAFKRQLPLLTICTLTEYGGHCIGFFHFYLVEHGATFRRKDHRHDYLIVSLN